MRDLPATIEQSEFHIQEDKSDRLDHSEDSSILSTENELKDNHSHIKFKTDIQMHDLHTFIGANGSGFKGEFAVRKQIIIANPYLTLLYYCINMFIQYCKIVSFVGDDVLGL